jgi:hypothetical protein
LEKFFCSIHQTQVVAEIEGAKNAYSSDDFGMTVATTGSVLSMQ